MSTSVICPIVFSLHGGTTCTIEPLTMKVSHSIQVLSPHTKLSSVIAHNTHIIVLSGYGLLRKGNGYLYHLWCASECSQFWLQLNFLTKDTLIPAILFTVE